MRLPSKDAGSDRSVARGFWPTARAVSTVTFASGHGHLMHGCVRLILVAAHVLMLEEGRALPDGHRPSLSSPLRERVFFSAGHTGIAHDRAARPEGRVLQAG